MPLAVATRSEPPGRHELCAAPLPPSARPVACPPDAASRGAGEKSREHAEIDAALRDVRASRPPISGKLVGKVVEISIKQAKFFKGITYELDRFLRKAKAEYRIPAFYLINAVCQASKTKFRDKDQYVPRFMEKGMPGFETLAECDDAEKTQIAKVLKFWVEERIFPELFVRKVGKAIGATLELELRVGA